MEEEEEQEEGWRRVLRRAASPSRDLEALCAELAGLELAGPGAGAGPGAREEHAWGLLRVAQDLLKYKGEQVSALLGEIDTLTHDNGAKRRKRISTEDSPTRSTDSYLETITHQEEEIKANKEILEQLYTDIAELEGRKKQLSERSKMELDRDSNSSRDPMSEMDSIRQLEREVAMKNKHIRKMLVDIKMLEEENRLLKEKVSVVKEKLSEATRFIENLTQQVLKLKNESTVLKESIGKTEEEKAELGLEIENLKKKLSQDFNKNELSDEMQIKLLHWKTIARERKSENETLQREVLKLKETQATGKDDSYLSTLIHRKDEQIRQLQEKLSEASDEILDSVKLIEVLKAENKRLKNTHVTEQTDATVVDTTETVDRASIKWKRKVHSLSAALKIAEDTLGSRERELAEALSHVQLMDSGEAGVQALIDTLKSKKRQLKLKDVGIKSLVREVNTLTQAVDQLQIENEAMREQLNIPSSHVIPTDSILSKFHNSEKQLSAALRKIQSSENSIVELELKCRGLEKTVDGLKGRLCEAGCGWEQELDGESMPVDGGGDASGALAKNRTDKKEDAARETEEMQALVEENSGLRQGMEEILEFLKDNSTSTSGTLAVQCPTLEKVVQSLDARHSAGWYAPHMAAVLGFHAAIGGRDALLAALHQARKETFDVMEKLSKEVKKSTHLEEKLKDIENKTVDLSEQPKEVDNSNIRIGVFGTWMSDKELDNVKFTDKDEIEHIVKTGNNIYETHLKEGLMHFHTQFKTLYEKMTQIAVESTNNNNKWAIEEEKYKAEIISLKVQLENKGEDASENSAGIVDYPNSAAMTRKCSYLEESYRYIRTHNENIKNELLETERQKMILVADYESHIQMLILNIANLMDRLRNSISIDLFLNQNNILNELNIKYRNLLDTNLNFNGTLLLDNLEKEKTEIIETLMKEINKKNMKPKDKVLDSTEHDVVKMQLKNVCIQLEETKKQLSDTQSQNNLLQLSQKELIDSTISVVTKNDYELLEEQSNKVTEENRKLKDQCSHISNQLDIALLQLQDTQQRQMQNDMELNMLRHQILDLQSTGDNKAIIARLSGEILVAHLQTSDTHKKLDRLSNALNKEKQRRCEAEEMLRAREKIFDVYAARFDFRFRYMIEVLQTLRHQYQGSIPTASLENYLNNIEEHSRKNREVDEKLAEVEDLRCLLLAKTRVFNGIIESGQCPMSEKECPHDVKLRMAQTVHTRELEHYSKKIQLLEQSRLEMSNRCAFLERTLVLVNQGFDRVPLDSMAERKALCDSLQVEDVPSDDDDDESRKSHTIILPKPQILKPLGPAPASPIERKVKSNDEVLNLPGSPIKLQTEKKIKSREVNTALVQTDSTIFSKAKMIQTENDISNNKLKKEMKTLYAEKEKKEKELTIALSLASQRAEDILALETSKVAIEANINSLKEALQKKDDLINKLEGNIVDLKEEIDKLKYNTNTEKSKKRDSVNEETKALLQAIKRLEEDKNTSIEEYKEMLRNEREEYTISIRETQVKIKELQAQLDRHENNQTTESSDNRAIAKKAEKVVSLENRCFKLQTTIDSCKTELNSRQNELERWKALALERLTKMEQLRTQFEDRHSHEIESYRAESQHWLSQLAECQKETLEFRNKIADQRALYIKQLTEKDAHIEQSKSTIQHLKSQIMSIQSMISTSDPTFDLSAIIEVEEHSDISPHGSERLEILEHDDYTTKEPSITSPTWQENLVDRLRREKQLVGKQNALLRRQIKSLAGRERRSRLEAQNLKSQMYRLTSSGSKISSSSIESSTLSLHNKLAALQSQLSAARRDTQAAGMVAWDKWKRAQQAADKWQSKYEERCEELKKCETSLSYAKSAISRLEREKRVLLMRLQELRGEKQLTLSKQAEEPIKSTQPKDPELPSLPPHITVQSLLDRIEAQQRRIAALQLADKGHEPLVTEYEKVLSQNTLLKGQILKLESQLLETQLKCGPLKASNESQSELGHLRSYCETLKDENMQLSAKVCSMSTLEVGTHTSAAQKINDLEQTVLTLRGLVSKLQADQKKIASPKRMDMLRFGSGLSPPEQDKTQPELSRVEVGNLRKSIAEKDLLLERSREMLKLAAEREEALLQEITYLRHCLEGGTNSSH